MARAILLPAFLVAVLPWAQAAEKEPDFDALVLADVNRLHLIDLLQSRLASQVDSLRAMVKTRGKEYAVRRTQAAIEDLIDQLEGLTQDPPIFPPVPPYSRHHALAKVSAYKKALGAVSDFTAADLRRMRVGDRFRFPDELPIRVFQIHGKEDMRLAVAGGFSFWLHGLPTGGLVENQLLTFSPAHIFEVTGTKDDGASTRFVVQPAELKGKPSAEEFKQALREAEAVHAEVAVFAAEMAKEEAEARQIGEALRRTEEVARANLIVARALLVVDRKDMARAKLEEIITLYPSTKAAQEARRLRKMLR